MITLTKPKKRNRWPSRVLFVTAAAIVLGYGGLRVVQWWMGGPASSTVEASAPQHLENAARFIAEGKLDEAASALDPILKHAHHETMTTDAFLLMARIETTRGNNAAAHSFLDRVSSEYPQSPNRPKAMLAKARLLEKEQRFDEAVGIYQEAKDSLPKEFQAAALTGLARHAERSNNLVEALGHYREAAAIAPWDSADWNEAVDGLGKANVTLIFSPVETPESKAYAVERGDSLTSIGMKLNTTIGLLTRANNLPEDASLQVGQALKWTPKDFRIIVERSTNRLFLMDNGGVFKRYGTGLGKPGYETALGSYKIGSKQKDPTWFKPGEGPIPAGDPRNELGTRWMPLVPLEESLPTDLGIHGALDPSTIGKYSSNGCARMAMPDVEELYDLVVRSTPVTIVDVFPEDLRGQAS
ncbi:MAG: hypothetical protein AMXMBFR84_51100 [Candidatus Hydrogenedentota bacterium]